MSSREDQKTAWRANVARADRALCATIAASREVPANDEDAAEAAKYRFYDAWEAFDLAIAAPKPWARPRAGADLGKWGPFETLRRDLRVGPSGLTFREFCRQGYGAPCLWRAMNTLRRKRRAAQRRRQRTRPR